MLIATTGIVCTSMKLSIPCAPITSSSRFVVRLNVFDPCWFDGLPHAIADGVHPADATLHGHTSESSCGSYFPPGPLPASLPSATSCDFCCPLSMFRSSTKFVPTKTCAARTSDANMNLKHILVFAPKNKFRVQCPISNLFLDVI